MNCVEFVIEFWRLELYSLYLDCFKLDMGWYIDEGEIYVYGDAAHQGFRSLDLVLPD